MFSHSYLRSTDYCTMFMYSYSVRFALSTHVDGMLLVIVELGRRTM